MPKPSPGLVLGGLAAYRLTVGGLEGLACAFGTFLERVLSFRVRNVLDTLEAQATTAHTAETSNAAA